jgi:tetratricopeptide (TPR) repeat protein
MPQEALESVFVQREELALQITDRVRATAFSQKPQHTILTGPRGIGKTHLVSLLYYRLRDMEDLRGRLVIAWLREEEWGVTSYLDMLLRIIQALGSEDDGNGPLRERIDALYAVRRDRAAAAAELLIETAAKGKSLLLLLENLDELLQGMGPEGRAGLERFLRASPFCSVLATSQSLSAEVRSFCGWHMPSSCHVHRLEELTLEDATRLLGRIAGLKGDRQLAAFLETPKGLARVRALRNLAGGNHRAYVIFSHFLTRDTLDDLVEPLMQTLDDLTPYYQARMAWLLPVQRKIVTCMCECNHPVSLQEIASKCFLAPDEAYAQLAALRKIGQVHAFTIASDRYFELREPLMRLSIEVKKHRGRPVRMLVDFLRLWFSPAELQQRLALLPADSQLERSYAVPALQAGGDGSEHPRVQICCNEYNSALASGDDRRALEAARELVALRGSPADLSALGATLQSLERHQEALECYESLIALTPKDPLPWLLSASAHRKLGSLQEALRCCDRALEIDPKSARAWSDRGVLLQSCGQLEQALASLDLAIRLAPADPFLWMSRGITLSDLGSYAEAVESFEKAGQLDPADSTPGMYLCAALIEMKQYETALVQADRSLRNASSNPQLWALRGTALAGLERHGEALQALEHAIRLGETSPYVLHKRAEILLAEDQWRDGISALDEVLGRVDRAEQRSAAETVAVVRTCLRWTHDEAGLQLRLRLLLLVYLKHQALASLARALVESIPDIVAAPRHESQARRWSDCWRSTAGSRSEFRLPLRLLDAAITYHETSDVRVLMELPYEERVLLEPLLGIQVQATA